MEVVRYRPDEAIRWLQAEADRLRTDAKMNGKSATEPSSADFAGVSESVKNAAGAVINFGKSAYADFARIKANATEYALMEEHFDVVTGTSIKSIPYRTIKEIHLKGDKATLTLDKGTLVIKPFAHLVAGPVKVALGWQRNGLEAPYRLLIEEISARAKIDIKLA